MKGIPVNLPPGVLRLGSTADIVEIMEAAKESMVVVMVTVDVKVPLKIYQRI